MLIVLDDNDDDNDDDDDDVEVHVTWTIGKNLTDSVTRHTNDKLSQ